MPLHLDSLLGMRQEPLKTKMTKIGNDTLITRMALRLRTGLTDRGVVERSALQVASNA